MAIDTSTWPTSDLAEDLDPFLRDFTEDDDPVTEVVNAACGRCGATVFSVHLDDDEGAAQRTCTTCGAEFVMLDSADVIQEADLEEAACPCGCEAFNVAVGFAFHDDGDVRWVYVGLRCVADGILGCYADWSIDYSPSAHLRDLV